MYTRTDNFGSWRRCIIAAVCVCQPSSSAIVPRELRTRRLLFFPSFFFLGSVWKNYGAQVDSRVIVLSCLWCLEQLKMLLLWLLLFCFEFMDDFPHTKKRKKLKLIFNWISLDLVVHKHSPGARLLAPQNQKGSQKYNVQCTDLSRYIDRLAILCWYVNLAVGFIWFDIKQDYQRWSESAIGFVTVWQKLEKTR